MKCKNCSAEWEGESTICPKCGTDVREDIPAETPGVTQDIPAGKPETTQDAPAAKSGMSAGRIALLVVLAVAAVAAVVALIVSSVKGKPDAQDSTTYSGETTVATEPDESTEPDETTKDPERHSYTVSDEKAIAAHDNVVATMGDEKLTNGLLQLYYWENYYEFMSAYGSYAEYFGLDTTLPLDQQDCSDGKTWQQYFLDNAVTLWQQYLGLSLQAQAEGFTIPEDQQKLLDTLPEDLEKTAADNGFASVGAMLESSFGPGVTLEDYQQYMNQYQLGYWFYQSKYSEIEPTDADIEKYYADHEEDYTSQGVTKDSVTVDVRHVLLQPENGETDENGKTTYSSASWNACKIKAEAMLKEWADNGATEESFAELASSQSMDPGSSSNGGLYTAVEQGQMVGPFDTWCFDTSRKTGDYGLVKTDFGYHLMYFVGKNPVWYEKAKSGFMAEASSKIISEAVDKYELNVKFDEIVLGNLPEVSVDTTPETTVPETTQAQ